MNNKENLGQDWGDCIGAASWLREPLQSRLCYSAPLPVQQAVIPIVSRAVLSGIPMDVSLTAPTGSGKTLCYLIPMLRLLTQEKKRNMDDTQLRAIILVPTKALGQQVFREIGRLTRHTTISVATLCGTSESGKSEARMLARCVRKSVGFSSDGSTLANVGLLKEEEDEMGDAAVCASSAVGGLTSSSRPGVSYDYFSLVDILVSTPQRLLCHLDGTVGLSLAALRLLVVDEADQVLEGSFANLVVKVVERFEEEVHAMAVQEKESATLRSFSGGPTQGGDAYLKHLSFSAHHVRKTEVPRTLHKVLCSATLSPRIARISQVHLRNCQYFTLDTHGEDISKGANITSLAHSGSALGANALSASSGSSNPPAPASVGTAFALPPALQEHVVFVEESYRHAVLLKLITTLLKRIAERQRRAAREPDAFTVPTLLGSDEQDPTEEPSKGETQEKAVVAPEAALEKEKFQSAGRASRNHAAVEEDTYPSVDDRSGSGILVFCSSAEEARVMGHFLSSAGITGVLEFTTLATEAERRRALLRPCSCVVASDALMRGIDIPNVGHVIMYHPPETLSQYVHRSGRTARAMRPGHVHLLLNKTGSSGTQSDGEVSAFKKLSASCVHTLPTRFERGFFMFAAAPHTTTTTTSAITRAADKQAEGLPTGKRSRHEGGKTVPEVVEKIGSGEGTVRSEATENVGPARGTAEWWVEEANRFLELSQQQLRQRWASAVDFAEKVRREGAEAPSAPALSRVAAEETLVNPDRGDVAAHPGKGEPHHRGSSNYEKDRNGSKRRPFTHHTRRPRGK